MLKGVTSTMGAGSDKARLCGTTCTFSLPSSLALISLFNGAIPDAGQHGWEMHGDRATIQRER